MTDFIRLHPLGKLNPGYGHLDTEYVYINPALIAEIWPLAKGGSSVWMVGAGIGDDIHVKDAPAVVVELANMAP